MKWIKSWVQVLNESHTFPKGNENEIREEMLKILVRNTGNGMRRDQMNLDELADMTLRVAIGFLDISGIETLLALGVNPNLRFKTGSPYEIGDIPIGMTLNDRIGRLSENRNIKILEILLKYGADINLLTDTAYDQETALHRACKFKKAKVVEFLLNNGADPNIKDAMGETPLFDAVRSGCYKCIELLSSAGVNLNQSNNGGLIPIQIAFDHERKVAVRIIKILVGFGADPRKAFTGGFNSLASVKGWFGRDLSWIPGGEEWVERIMKASDTRRKMF